MITLSGRLPLPPAAVDFSGTGQYLSRSEACLSTGEFPVTFGAWINPDANPGGAGAAIITVGGRNASAQLETYEMRVVTSGGSMLVRGALIEAGASTDYDLSAAIVESDGWVFIAAVFDTSASATIYARKYDLGGPLLSASGTGTARSPTWTSAISTNICARIGGSLNLNGQIAHPFVCKSDLPFDLIDQLSLGMSPIALPPRARLRAYWHLANSAHSPDQLGLFHLSPTGTPTDTVGPSWIYIPVQRKVIVNSAAAAGGQPTMKRWQNVPHMGGSGFGIGRVA